MSEFQRSSSKVWWVDDSPNLRRRASASPGSQDSGFSDTETSPSSPSHRAKKNNEITPEQIRRDVTKNGTAEKLNQNQNLSSNIKEKLTPRKSLMLISNTTPVRKTSFQARSEPAGFKYHKKTQKSGRNLFRSIQIDSLESNQYAEDIVDSVGTQHLNKTTSEVTFEDNHSWLSNDSSEAPEGIRSLPILCNNPRVDEDPASLSAPAILTDDEAVTPFNLSSDCESELECLFSDSIESPKHTSTPKIGFKKDEKINFQKKRAMNLMLRYQHERLPPTALNEIEEGTALRQWTSEIRRLYEPECMTTLQCKSIAGELAERVNHLGATITLRLRELIGHSQLIEDEFVNIKSNTKHIRPLCQSLSGFVIEFVEKYFDDPPKSITKQCEDLRTTNEIDDLVAKISKLHISWKNQRGVLLKREVKNLVSNMEDPRSELHVRAMLTGLTSITLRSDELVGLFVSSGAIQILLVLCEKCEGSTVRSLALRALSTICTNCSAIRQFEKAQGVQMLSDVICEQSRPEPERSEAVALLAQITAPWIEDNHNINGLQERDKKIVKTLTKFALSTNCCQNLLLCMAALANLTTMHPKTINYILKNDTVRVLLDAVKRRGPRVSIYHLEQIATLIANISANENCRTQLIRDEAAKALLCFLHASSMDEEVVKRLQQKSVIALSRLSSEKEAADQIVEQGGVEKLVKLCREKKERHDSDAVLVAALATLRKIAEACGDAVINTQDVQELVEPRLLDSFLAYSAQNESYV